MQIVRRNARNHTGRHTSLLVKLIERWKKKPRRRRRDLIVVGTTAKGIGVCMFWDTCLCRTMCKWRCVHAFLRIFVSFALHVHAWALIWHNEMKLDPIRSASVFLMQIWPNPYQTPPLGQAGHRASHGSKKGAFCSFGVFMPWSEYLNGLAEGTDSVNCAVADKHIFMHVHVCMYVCMYVYFMCVHLWWYVICACVDVYAYVHACIHACMTCIGQVYYVICINACVRVLCTVASWAFERIWISSGPAEVTFEPAC